MSAAFTDEQMRLAALPCAHLQARPAFSQMNPYHLLTLTLVFAVFTASAEHPITPWNATAHIPLQDFIIQSHRGAGELSTDNTREAFDLGWQLGTVPEADTELFKDYYVFTSLQAIQNTHNRFYGGLRFIGGHAMINAEVSYSVFPSFRDSGANENRTIPGVLAVTGSLGLDF